MARTTKGSKIKKEVIGMLVKSIRNGVLAEVISENEETVQLKMKDSGEVKDFTTATFKRWWKEAEGEEVSQTTPAENNDSKEDTAGADQGKTNDTGKEDKSGKNGKKEDAADGEDKPKKKGRTVVAGDHPLKGVIESLATEKGLDIFEGKVKGFRSLKVDGNMCMAFTFNTKGISLWLREAAIAGLNLEYKHMNHMFNARVNVTEDNAESKVLIEKVLDASIKYQVEKKASTLKAQKDKRREEKAAEKASKESDANEGAEAE